MKTFPVLLASVSLLALCASAQTPASLEKPIDQPVTQLPEVSVVAHLDQDRNEIVPALGATSYSISSQRLETQSQGSDAPFNETILRIPGVAQDSFGQLHVRGDHANLQYRINDVLIPEGISGFGQELDTRFVDHLSLITGALPSQFGIRTAGIVDIHTKSGDDLKGGEISMYGGSFGTLRPSIEYGGIDGRLSYYFTASYLQSDIGIENPTNRPRAIHDETQQEKFFGSISYLIDDTSRLNLLLSSSYGHFQIPNNPNQTPAFTLSGVKPFNSSLLNENQREQNYYSILSYQKSAGDLNYQISAFARYSGLLYTPDPAGDLIFNGVAGRIDRNIFSTGLQSDASYRLTDNHTLRGGLSFTSELAKVNTSTNVFATDAMGNQTSFDPFNIIDDSKKQAYLYGAYLQDEWKIGALTINYGARFDMSDAFLRENQLSPRINFVYELTESTTLHAGYARYFTPPPLELVQQSSITKFAGTTNAPANPLNSPVLSERDHYFDVGAVEKISRNFQIGLDGYYKKAQDLLDEGQFGQALIFSPFNYKQGQVYGVEFTANYQQDNFAAYTNLAVSRATATDIISGQFEFDPTELAYIKTHNVYLDHDERIAASTGMSYDWAGTRFSADLLYGSGLRAGFANTQKLGVYYPLNLGVSHTFNLGGGHKLKARIDLVNVLDQVYELRSGTGIGVGAPQFGQRRGIYFGLGYTF